MENEDLTLINLGNGGAQELFEEELQRVLTNILDPNTPATTKREIALKIIFKPTSERDSASIEVQASSKLAPMSSAHATVFVGRRRGKAVAITHDPKQLQMQWDEESKPRSVSEAKAAAGD